MKFVPRREKVRKGFSSPDGLALLAKATSAAKADNEAHAADPFSIKNNDLQLAGSIYRKDKETNVRAPAPLRNRKRVNNGN